MHLRFIPVTPRIAEALKAAQLAMFRDPSHGGRLHEETVQTARGQERRWVSAAAPAPKPSAPQKAPDKGRDPNDKRTWELDDLIGIHRKAQSISRSGLYHWAILNRSDPKVREAYHAAIIEGVTPEHAEGPGHRALRLAWARHGVREALKGLDEGAIADAVEALKAKAKGDTATLDLLEIMQPPAAPAQEPTTPPTPAEPGALFESSSMDFTSLNHHAQRADGAWFTRGQYKDPAFGYKWSAWKPSGPPPENARRVGGSARLPNGKAPEQPSERKPTAERARKLADAAAQEQTAAHHDAEHRRHLDASGAARAGGDAAGAERHWNAASAHRWAAVDIRNAIKHPRTAYLAERAVRAAQATSAVAEPSALHREIHTDRLGRTEARMVRDESAKSLAPEVGPPPARNRQAHPFVGTIRIPGLPKIRVETKKGQTRSGVDPDGNAWSVTMPAHYGEFHGTRGVDGDPVDVFVGPDVHAPYAYVFHMSKLGGGGYDEDKASVGFQTREDAERCLRDAYDRAGLFHAPPKRLTIAELAHWLADPENKGRMVDAGREMAKAVPVTVQSLTGGPPRVVRVHVATAAPAPAQSVAEAICEGEDVHDDGQGQGAPVTPTCETCNVSMDAMRGPPWASVYDCPSCRTQTRIPNPNYRRPDQQDAPAPAPEVCKDANCTDPAHGHEPEAAKARRESTKAIPAHLALD